MNPISNERVEWVKNRLKVVHACKNEAYTAANDGFARRDGPERDRALAVIREFTIEEIKLTIELKVLQHKFDVHA